MIRQRTVLEESKNNESDQNMVEDKKKEDVLILKNEN